MSKNKIIFIVITSAFILRLGGMFFGLPYLYHPDEPVALGIISRMMATGDFNPHFFDWGSLYLYIIFFAGLIFKNIGWLKTLAGLVMLGRFVSVLLGTAAVGLTYLCARKLYNNFKTALLAGLFMAICFLHARCSHYMTVDVTAVFFLMVSLSCMLSADKKNNLYIYILAGFFAGAAAATKYNTTIIFLTMLIFPLLQEESKPVSKNEVSIVPVSTAAGSKKIKKIFSMRGQSAIRVNRRYIKMIIVAVGGLAGFIVCCPYSILDAAIFRNSLANLLFHYNNPALHPRNYGNMNTLFYFHSIFAGEWGELLSVLSAAGLILTFVRRRPRELCIYTFPVITFIILSASKVNFTRNLIPVMPFLALWAAFACQWLWQRTGGCFNLSGQAKTVIALSGLILVCSLPVYRIICLDYLLTAPDTRDRATEWMAAHILPGRKFAVEEEPWATPALPASSYGQRFVLPEHNTAWYKNQGFDYIVTNSISYEAYFAYPGRTPKRRWMYLSFFKDLGENCLLLAEFKGKRCPVPVNDELPNPDIRIYKVNSLR